MTSSEGVLVDPGFEIVCSHVSNDTSIVPVCDTVKSQPQLTALPAAICTGSPVLVTFQPYCQPKTRLANVLTPPVPVVQFQLVPQPTRSPVWHVPQTHCWPLVLPLATPHWLLFTQYLPMSTDALAVQLLPVIGAVPQLTLLGSMHPPYRHCVPATVQVVPHAPQLLGSVFVSTHVPAQTDCPAGHAHKPPEHDAPEAHAVHPPQWATLAVTSTHCPPAPHGPSPVGQRHAPIQHDWSG